MKKVYVYALSNCPWCAKTKQFFAERHVPYDYIDYDLADQQTQEKIRSQLEDEGVSGFPFTRIGDETVTGYAPDKFAQLLA